MTADDAAYPELEDAPPVEVSGSVSVSGSVPVEERAAHHGAYSTYTFAGTEAAQPVTAYDAGRARAYVYPVTGTVIIGSRAQVQASPPLGFTLTAGMPPLVIGHRERTWIVPSGAAQVSVAIERWDK